MRPFLLIATTSSAASLRAFATPPAVARTGMFAGQRRAFATGAAVAKARAFVSMAQPQEGSLVQVKWSLTEGGSPLPEAIAQTFDQGDVMFVVGGGGYLPCLHSKVRLLSAVGVAETFDVPPVEGFGEADPDMGPAEVPWTSCPPGLTVGAIVQLQSGAKARVVAVDEGVSVSIDANHPLAGKALQLTAELTAEPRAAEEVLEYATFAAGCFWGVELAFQREPGVVCTEVGYTQGAKETPSYEEVCNGGTGHTEAVRVQFDPAATSYARLCALFWERLGESRYLLNQVGNDQGTQYRHGIYTHGEAQAEEAARTLAGAGGGSNLPVQTEVEAAERWWPAEDYHQQYLQKGGQSARKQAAETIRCYG